MNNDKLTRVTVGLVTVVLAIAIIVALRAFHPGIAASVAVERRAEFDGEREFAQDASNGGHVERLDAAMYMKSLALVVSSEDGGDVGKVDVTVMSLLGSRLDSVRAERAASDEARGLPGFTSSLPLHSTRIMVRVPTTGYFIRVVADGYAEQVVTDQQLVTTTESTPYVITLRRARFGVLAGIVLKNEHAEEGATVTITPERPEQNWTSNKSQSVATNREGAFAFRGIEPGVPYWLVARSRDGIQSSMLLRPLAIEETRADLQVVLPSTTAVQIRVVNSASEEPVEGAWIQPKRIASKKHGPTGQRFGLDRWPMTMIQSQTDGTATIQRLDDALIEVRVSCSGYVPTTVEVEPQTSEVVLPLRHLTSVAVRVRGASHDLSCDLYPQRGTSAGWIKSAEPLLGSPGMLLRLVPEAAGGSPVNDSASTSYFGWNHYPISGNYLTSAAPPLRLIARLGDLSLGTLDWNGEESMELVVDGELFCRRAALGFTIRNANRAIRHSFVLCAERRDFGFATNSNNGVLFGSTDSIGNFSRSGMLPGLYEIQVRDADRPVILFNGECNLLTGNETDLGILEFPTTIDLRIKVNRDEGKLFCVRVWDYEFKAYLSREGNRMEWYGVGASEIAVDGVSSRSRKRIELEDISGIVAVVDDVVHPGGSVHEISIE